MANSIIKLIEKGGAKYRLLDYIQSTGTQYINLGNFSWNADTDVLETKFKFDTISTTSTALWLYSLQGTSMSFDFYSQNSVFNLRPYQVAQTVYQMPQDTDVHNLKLDSANGKIYLDGVEKFSGIQKSSIGNVQFNLFRRNTGTGYASARIYNFFISRNGTKILDLIPVERISDNAIGLLDLISGTLYTNAGSGTFGKSYQLVEHIYKPKLKAKTYEKLEYLESNSSNQQYIKLPQDTLSTQNIKVYADIAVNDLSNDMVILGLRPSDSDTRRQLPDITGDKIYIGANRNIATNKTIDTNRHTHIYDFGHYGQAGYLDDVLIWNGTETLEEWQGTSIRPQYYLFAQNNTGRSGSLPGLFFSGKTYEIKIWSNYVLTYHLIPVKRLKDNAIGMLDTLTNTFYGNSGSGVFVGQSLSTPEYIEEDVEQVDYIQASGTQYINTLLNLEPSKTIIDTKYEWTSQPSQYDRVFGVMDSSTTQLALTADTTTTQMGTYYAEQGANLGTISLNTPYTLTMKNGQVILNGTSRSVQTKTGTLVNRLILFGLNNNGTITRLSKSKIYYFKITHNGEVIMNLIPVKYGTEYCLLDLVEMKLYHNKGTGAFTGGNRVEVSKITQCLISNNVKYYPLDYIQSSGTQYIDTGITGEFSGEIDYQFVNETGGTSKFHALFGSQLVNAPYNYTTFRLSTDKTPHSLEFATLITNQTVHKFDFDTNRHKIEFITSTTREYLKQDNNVLVDSSLTGRSYNGLSMALFGMNEGGRGIVHTSSSRIFSAKIKQNNSLILDLIPVERATDNAKGMLDILSGTFYGNSGSGTFTGNKRIIELIS